MDLLEGYESSASSSSSSSSPILLESQYRPAHRSSLDSSNTTNHNDALFLCDKQNALSIDAPNHFSGAGCNGHRPSSSIGDDYGRSIGDSSCTSSSRSHGCGGRNKRSTTGIKRLDYENVPSMEEGVENNHVNGGEMEMLHIEKKQKIKESIPKVAKVRQVRSNVMIAGYDDQVRNGKSDNAGSSNNSNQEFERGQPHWEGRWVGHLHLPFPNFEYLDNILGDAIKNVSTNKNHDPDREKEFKSKEQCQGSDSYEERNASCSSDESISSSSSSSSEEEENNMPQSRLFLPAARKLIHNWARLLQNGTYSTTTNDFDGGEENAAKSDIIIIPHIPMHPIETKITNSSTTSLHPPMNNPSPLSTKSLHISLTRPIYLPAPSVDPFLADIQKSMNAILSFANKNTNTTINNNNPHRHSSSGRILHLHPQKAAIFTNDQQTRSFLTIPVSTESSRWVKRSLLPSINAAMVRFGLETYYSTEEEGGCILHASVASVKGNVIPQMLLRSSRRQGKKGGSTETSDHEGGNENKNKIRSILLFSTGHKQFRDVEVLDSIPRCIPVRVNRMECDFGCAKKLTIPF